MKNYVQIKTFNEEKLTYGVRPIQEDDEKNEKNENLQTASEQSLTKIITVNLKLINLTEL